MISLGATEGYPSYGVVLVVPVLALASPSVRSQQFTTSTRFLTTSMTRTVTWINQLLVHQRLLLSVCTAEYLWLHTLACPFNALEPRVESV